MARSLSLRADGLCSSEDPGVSNSKYWKESSTPEAQGFPRNNL